jgi:predicted MFS family arabinose efflux permease
VVFLVFAVTACGTPCYPATAAAVAAAIPEDDLAPANGILTTVETVAFASGPAAGGLLLAVLPPAATLAVGAALFGVALLSCVLLPREDPRIDAVAGTEESGWQLVLGGVRAVAATAGAAVPVVLVTAVNLVYGCLVVAFVLVSEEMGTGARGVGMLNVGLGLGSVLGVLAVNPLARRRRPTRVLAATTAVASLPVALLVVVGAPAAAVALVGIAGAGGVVTEILSITLVQRLLPAHHIGRVVGLLDAVLVAAILAGSVLTPLLVDLVGLSTTLVLAGLVLPVCALAAAAVLRTRSIVPAVLDLRTAS